MLARRLVRLQGKAQDVKQHRWFESFDWDALAARKLAAPRRPRDDAAKRIRELAVSMAGLHSFVVWFCMLLFESKEQHLHHNRRAQRHGILQSVYKVHGARC